MSECTCEEFDRNKGYCEHIFRINSGGNAFPVPIYKIAGDQQIGPYTECGMTLLDYFAAASLAGYRASEAQILHEEIARLAFGDAKAMLAERQKMMKNEST